MIGWFQEVNFFNGVQKILLKKNISIAENWLNKKTTPSIIISFSWKVGTIMRDTKHSLSVLHSVWGSKKKTFPFLTISSFIQPKNFFIWQKSAVWYMLRLDIRAVLFRSLCLVNQISFSTFFKIVIRPSQLPCDAHLCRRAEFFQRFE